MDAGWYPDPYERLPWRWWDGSRWTAYAADSAVRWDEVEEDGETTPQQPGLPALALGVIAFAAGVGLAVLVQIALRAGDDPDRLVELGLSQLALWVPIIAATVFVSRRSGTGSLARDFGFSFRRIDVGFGLAGSVAARLAAAIVILPLPTSYRRARAPDRTVFEEAADGWGWVVLVLLVCVGAPLVEEVFFRGLLQTRLVAVAGPAGGIAIASLLFGGAHMISWQGAETFTYAAAIAGAGLVLGLMRHLTGRLGPPIAAHAFFNIQAVIAAGLLQ